MSHVLVIVNPRSGARSGERVLSEVTPRLAQAGKQVRVRPTTRPGEATEIAHREPLTDVSGIAVIGGDGTLHEVLNGLFARDEPALPPVGLIPCGTGNTVAADLQIRTPQDAIAALLAGKTRPMDIMRAELPGGTAYCSNIIGWGAVTDINTTAEKLRWVGGSRYTLAALWHLLLPRPRPLRVTINGQTRDGEYLFALACNTRSTGRGMLVAPHADLADGQVDLVLVRNTSRRQLLRTLQGVFHGTHLQESCVEYELARDFAWAPSEPMGLNLDGELRGTTPCQVTVLPRALSVFAP